ncbi:hypothetical protein GT043_13075 [Streptomyces sp. SID2131]|nr:hypothetical protein [Streptomyces sp. SID2131]
MDKHGIHECKNGGELLVLLRVANHMHGGMRGCYASGATLAAECLMGESTVLKHLRRLKAGGVLIPGDPKLVAHLRADRRPPVYDLAGGHDKGCPGEHSEDVLCESVITGARSEHPSKKARATGARSEHPPKKRRSAGGQNEHPSDRTPATGVQIDLSRVFKSSTNSSKELNSLFFVPAGAFAARPSQPPQDERETTQQQDQDRPERPTSGKPSVGPTCNGEAAAPEAGRGNSETSRAGEDADVVVNAYVTALGRPLVNGSRERLRGQAAELLAAGYSVEWLAARAAEMPAKRWRDLIKHVDSQEPESVPAQRSASTTVASRSAVEACGLCDDLGWVLDDDDDGPLIRCAHPGVTAGTAGTAGTGAGR